MHIPPAVSSNSRAPNTPSPEGPTFGVDALRARGNREARGGFEWAPAVPTALQSDKPRTSPRSTLGAPVVRRRGARAQGPCAVLLQLRPHGGHGPRHGRGCRRGGGRGGRDARSGNRAGSRGAGQIGRAHV